MRPSRSYVLSEAASRLEDDSKFCRNVFARDDRGNEVPWHSESACRWCAIGWLRVVSKEWYVKESILDPDEHAWGFVSNMLSGLIDRPRIDTMNDLSVGGRTDVIKYLRRLADEFRAQGD